MAAVKIQEALIEQHDSKCGQYPLQAMKALNYINRVYEKLHELSDLYLNQVKELQREKQI